VDLLAAGLLEEPPGARAGDGVDLDHNGHAVALGACPRSPSMIAAQTSSLISGATRARPSMERNILGTCLQTRQIRISQKSLLSSHFLNAAGGVRTHDLRIKSPLLYQLSYSGGLLMIAHLTRRRPTRPGRQPR
jgi:hypothetical protein